MATGWKDTTLWRSGLRRIASLRKPVQLISCVIIVFQCLLLASCAFPNMLASIYIVRFSLAATDKTAGFSVLDIRIGYFYQCVRTERDADWSCGDRSSCEERLREVSEPWNLVKTAFDLRDEAVSSSLLIMAMVATLVLMVVMSLFPTPYPLVPGETYTLWRRDMWLEKCLVLGSSLGVPLGLLAALWQHTVASTAAGLVAFLSGGDVVAAAGPAATAFAWLAFLLGMIVSYVCFKVGLRLARIRELGYVIGRPPVFSSRSRFADEEEAAEPDAAGGGETVEMASLGESGRDREAGGGREPA